MRAVLVSLLGAAALAGCGGGDDEEPTDDRGQIRALVADFYANDEGVCDLLTDRLLEKQFETEEDCEEEAEEAAAQEGHKVRGIKLGVDTAEVRVAVSGQKGTLLLVKRGGEWKIDGVRE